MSVYQHEQYYLHVIIKGVPVSILDKITLMLSENNWDDNEFTKDELVVDGFESECDALACDKMIGELLEMNKFNQQ